MSPTSWRPTDNLGTLLYGPGRFRTFAAISFIAALRIDPASGGARYIRLNERHSV